MERDVLIQATAQALSNAHTTKEMVSLRSLLDTLKSHKEEVSRLTSKISMCQAEKLIMENGWLQTKNSYEVLPTTTTFPNKLELRELANAGEELAGVTGQCVVQGSQPVNYEQTRKKELFFICFGLQFILNEDKTMKLAFTSLDPQNPARECYLVLDLDSNNQWIILDVQPKGVEGMKELICDLNNKTKHFGEFCKSVRAQFKRHIQFS